MRRDRAVFVLMACAASACGSPNEPGSEPWTEPATPLPVTHDLARERSATFAAGGNYGFSFSLPRSAAVSFSANQTTTDTWNVAIFTPQQWADYQAGTSNQAYAGVHNDVMQVSERVQLPSGDWYLGFHCTNLFERCMLVYSADATY